MVRPNKIVPLVQEPKEQFLLFARLVADMGELTLCDGVPVFAHRIVLDPYVYDITAVREDVEADIPSQSMVCSLVIIETCERVLSESIVWMTKERIITAISVDVDLRNPPKDWEELQAFASRMGKSISITPARLQQYIELLAFMAKLGRT